MLGYKNTIYQPQFNAPPSELVVPVAVVPESNVQSGADRTPPNAEDLSSTDGLSANFLSASWQSASWTFEPFAVVTWRVFRQLNTNLRIKAGDVEIAHVTGSEGDWVGGQMVLDESETVIVIGDATGSRSLVNVWVGQ